MQRGIFVLFLGGLVLLAGCTPVDESVVKRAERSDAEGAITASEEVGPEGNPGPEIEPSLKAFIQKHGATVKRQAARYGFDWRLILAIVEQESRFTSDAKSHKGARGLMQLMPVTGEEVARNLALDNVHGPDDNIRGGVYYLRTLHDLFEGVEEPDRTKLALAAYNAGIGRVYDAQELAAYLQESPVRWQSIRETLPLLSKRYYTLHQSVWEQEKPRSGWFGNARQTVAYVENVIGTYDRLREELN
jgi:membrane-bound lytic murein transglycosylase F